VTSPPQIFSFRRRRLARERMRHLQARPAAPRYLAEEMAEDIADRLSFLRHHPARALVIGDLIGALAGELERQGSVVIRADPVPRHGESPIDEEQPLGSQTVQASFDLVANVGTLDTVNDLPGALLHIHRALAPGGLMVASFLAAGTLPALRAAMLAADADRPAPRLHPQVDVRAGGQLLQRAGFADPVIDSRSVRVRFADLDRLVGDLRAQGLSNVLARPGPPLGREALARARAAFGTQVEETFEILTLTGWRR
jgi:SAM-dependent methyltransferase